SSFKRVAAPIAISLAAISTAGFLGVSLSSKYATAEQAQREQEAARLDRVQKSLIAAFENGQDKITYQFGETHHPCRILSHVNVKGDIVLSAHRAYELGPNGEILRIYTEPAVQAVIPAARRSFSSEPAAASAPQAASSPQGGP
ncbi:MAG: hypothetical protein AB7H77_10770, partial [Bdellovibrionales bacterium]